MQIETFSISSFYNLKCYISNYITPIENVNYVLARKCQIDFLTDVIPAVSIPFYIEKFDTIKIYDYLINKYNKNHFSLGIGINFYIIGSLEKFPEESISYINDKIKSLLILDKLNSI